MLGRGRGQCAPAQPGVCGPHAAQALVRGLGMATLQSPISPWALLSFSEEMPYLKCPLHAVLKLTPIAYGERGDPAPPRLVPPGGPGGAVSSGPPLTEADLSPPSPRLPSRIHLPERGVREHTPGEVRGECELEAPSSPLLCRLSGTLCGGGAGKSCVSRWHLPASVWTCGPGGCPPRPPPRFLGSVCFLPACLVASWHHPPFPFFLCCFPHFLLTQEMSVEEEPLLNVTTV